MADRVIRLRIDEISKLPEPQKKGFYALFKLEKGAISTREAVHLLAKKLRIVPEKISYVLNEDASTPTTQWITAETVKVVSGTRENYSAEFKGYLHRPIEPADVKENRFEAVIDPFTDPLLSKIEQVQKDGFVNYYDASYFAGHDPTQGFLAEKILKEHFNGAAKIYLTSVGEGMDEILKARRKFFFDNWKDWKLCLENSVTKEEKTDFHYLMRNPDHFLGFLHEIPRDELSFHFQSYQAHVWNRMAQRIYEEKERDNTYLRKTVFQTLSAKSSMPDSFVSRIYEDILETDGISRNLFNRSKFRKVYFKPVDRKLMVFPEISILEKSESLRIAFALPRQSSARTLLNRLTA